MTDQPTPAITPEQLAELKGLHDALVAYASCKCPTCGQYAQRIADTFPALQATIEGLWREVEVFRAFNPVVPHERHDSCRDWWHCLACHVEAIHDGDEAPAINAFPHAESCPWRFNANANVARGEDLRAIVDRQAKEIEALKGDIVCMVNKAADNCLDGYRELGAKAANAENALDTERATHAVTRNELAQLQSLAAAQADDLSKEAAVALAQLSTERAAHAETRKERDVLAKQLAVVVRQHNTAYGYGQDGGEPPWMK